jgi:hypothetical protein
VFVQEEGNGGWIGLGAGVYKGRRVYASFAFWTLDMFLFK